MDIGCEESSYDAYEYESEGCDDPEAIDDYEYVYNTPPGLTSYGGMSLQGVDPRYCESIDQLGSMYDEGDVGYDDDDDCFDTEDDSLENCVPCGDPSNTICPLPDPNVQCPPCKLEVAPCPTDEGPGLGDHGVKSICGQNLQRVNEIIQNIKPSTVLDEFMLSIANYTADNGDAMFDAMSNEVNNFKELIKEIYANRNDNVSDMLKAEQRHMKNRYEKLTRQIERKIEETMEAIRAIIPDFDMAAFVADPSNYIYSTMMASMKKQQPDSAFENSQSPERDYRVALHRRTWLVREAERVECDNEERMCQLNEMMAQLACLSEGLATNNKKLAAYNRQLESHATCLRNKLAYNETVLGCLADELEMNKVDEGQTDQCQLIEPDDILTPYPSGYDYC